MRTFILKHANSVTTLLTALNKALKAKISKYFISQPFTNIKMQVNQKDGLLSQQFINLQWCRVTEPTVFGSLGLKWSDDCWPSVANPYSYLSFCVFSQKKTWQLLLSNTDTGILI